MHLGPERLRAVIADALAAGTFVVCHDTLTYGDYPDYGPAICRGFYDAYADRSPALTLLRACQRLVEVPPPQAASPDCGSTRHGEHGHRQAWLTGITKKEPVGRRMSGAVDA